MFQGRTVSWFFSRKRKPIASRRRCASLSTTGPNPFHRAGRSGNPAHTRHRQRNSSPASNHHSRLIVCNGNTGLLEYLCIRRGPTTQERFCERHSGWSASAQLKDIGDNHAVSPGTYWGTSFNDAGKGFLHKMEWSCPGVTIINSGSYVLHGYCVLTDSEDLRHVRR